jgi:hypothetical protein
MFSVLFIGVKNGGFGPGLSTRTIGTEGIFGIGCGFALLSVWTPISWYLQKYVSLRSSLRLSGFFWGGGLDTHFSCERLGLTVCVNLHLLYDGC